MWKLNRNLKSVFHPVSSYEAYNLDNQDLNFINNSVIEFCSYFHQLEQNDLFPFSFLHIVCIKGKHHCQRKNYKDNKHNKVIYCIEIRKRFQCQVKSHTYISLQTKIWIF